MNEAEVREVERKSKRDTAVAAVRAGVIVGAIVYLVGESVVMAFLAAVVSALGFRQMHN